ncbi:hypothetical protein RRSWK_05142 [Rhodopirellula sp. SWK7]|nr:hypothetical protein RRSWK_05142 [Rhodopirellula sp. SWK7]
MPASATNDLNNISNCRTAIHKVANKDSLPTQAMKAITTPLRMNQAFV